MEYSKNLVLDEEKQLCDLMDRVEEDDLCNDTFDDELYELCENIERDNERSSNDNAPPMKLSEMNPSGSCHTLHNQEFSNNIDIDQLLDQIDPIIDDNINKEALDNVLIELREHIERDLSKRSSDDDAPPAKRVKLSEMAPSPTLHDQQGGAASNDIAETSTARQIANESVSHAVLRGQPTASQLYLDTILDAVVEAERAAGRGGREREQLNLGQVILYSMKLRPSSTLMINGLTEKCFTNLQILKRAVPIARALTDTRASGKTIMVVMKNHEQLVSVYYGALFAGVTLFMLEPSSTIFELRHFLNLVKPSLVFCDNDRYDDVVKAVKEADSGPGDVISQDKLDVFTAAQSDDLDSFVAADVDRDCAAVLLPTSGSTGLAKAAVLTHWGLMAQMPSLWSYHVQFPRPTECAMFLSTAQWMTHTNMLTSGPVYDITLLISPNKTPQHAIALIDKFQPTWTLLVPGFATMMAGPARADQLTSLKTALLTGAPPNPATMATLKKKLPDSAHLCNGYGMTEAHGFTSIPDRQTPFDSTGKVFNNFLYKLVDDDGREVTGANQNGELYLKSNCIIKGYLNNEAAYKECVSEDGWWKTGDVFYRDQSDYLFFVERKKFWFKYMNYHISPEELESIISKVPGVEDCVVCGSEAGAAAAVVVKPGALVTRDLIHQAVDSQVMEYKRVRGGIAFVTSLPRTHSGKLHRRDCIAMVQQLIRDGQCC